MRKALHSIAKISMMVVVRMVNRGAFLMGFYTPACLVVPTGYVPIAACTQNLTLTGLAD